MKLNLKIWRQQDSESKGDFEKIGVAPKRLLRKHLKQKQISKKFRTTSRTQKANCRKLKAKESRK